MLLSRNVKHLCTASYTNLFGACKGLADAGYICHERHTLTTVQRGLRARARVT